MAIAERHPSRWIEQVRLIAVNIVDLDRYALFLFGSRARHPDNSHGDIDVGLLGSEAVPQELLMRLSAAIDDSDVPLKKGCDQGLLSGSSPFR